MRKGLTLVELLVVLAILAAIASSVAVSADGMGFRAKVEEARRQGEAMRDAIRRSDGLSLAADMGMNPHEFSSGALGLLASRAFRIGTQRLPDERLDGENPGHLRFAPLYREYRLDELRASTTNLESSALAALDAAVANDAALSNAWSQTRLGGGWRGPYCTAAVQDSETRLLKDPFGGFWDVRVMDGADLSGTAALTSCGGDQIPDSCAGADTNDWRNADMEFPFSATNAAVSLTVEVSLESSAESSKTVHVYCISPTLDVANEECSMRGHMAHAIVSATAAGGSETIRDGLAPGEWAVFAFTSDGETKFAPVRKVVLSSGSNKAKILLETNL